MTTDRESHLKHISSRFNADLSQLKQDLLEMGGLVEQQLRQAIEALINSDVELAREVKAGDKKVDAMELAIDEEANRVIAKRQPTASDLRLVMSVVKMVADIERIGDEAKKIAKLTIALAEETSSPWGRVEVRHIGNHVACCAMPWTPSPALTLRWPCRSCARTIPSTVNIAAPPAPWSHT